MHIYKAISIFSKNNLLMIATTESGIELINLKISKKICASKNNWKTNFEKKMFFCVGEYAEYMCLINKG